MDRAFRVLKIKLKIDNLICKEVIFKLNHFPKLDMLVLCEDSSDIRRRRQILVVSNIVRPTYLILRRMTCHKQIHTTLLRQWTSMPV